MGDVTKLFERKYTDLHTDLQVNSTSLLPLYTVQSQDDDRRTTHPVSQTLCSHMMYATASW